jgi:anti-anti-sigma factor
MPEFNIQNRIVQAAPNLVILVQEVAGAIDGNTAKTFERSLVQIQESGHKNIIFIFTDVPSINSTGMGALIQFADLMRDGGGEICLVNVSKSVLGLFEMLGLLPILPVHPTEAEAVAHIAEKAGVSVTPPTQDTTAAVPEAAPEGEGEAGSDDEFFPLELTCPDCQKDLEIARPGYFRCPVCGCYFVAEDDGNVQAVRLDESKIAELRIPREPAMGEGLRKMSSILVESLGYPAQVATGIDRCLEHVWTLVTHGVETDGQRLHLYLVANPDEWVAGITFPGGPGGPPVSVDGLKPMADAVELAPIPTGGHVLRITIKVGSEEGNG